MYASAVEGHLGAGRIEVFVFQLTDASAVHRIGKISAEKGNIKEIGTRPHFFIRGKADFNGAVGNFRMGKQILRHSHNFRYPRFVVRTK